MAGKVFEISLLVVLVTAMCAVPSSAQAGCMPALANLSPCLGFITGRSSTPAESCCDQVAAVAKSQAQCLCSFLGNSVATQLGTIISQAPALSLPGTCKIDNPFQCNTAATGTQPPVARPPQGELAPAAPQDAPTSGSQAAPPSPTSVPRNPHKGHSKTTGQTSAAGASSKFMPLAFFLLLVASPASTLISSKFSNMLSLILLPLNI